MTPREPKWRRYLRFWKPSVRSDIDAELRFHFDARIADLGARGVDPAAARQQAINEFGDVAGVSDNLQEIDDRMARHHSRLQWLLGIKDDVVYAARSLRRTPTVTATIVLTLALGLGVNAAMFSFLDQVFGRYPAGVVAPQSVHRLWQERRFGDVTGTVFWPGFDYAGYRAVRDAVGDRARMTLYRLPTKSKLALGENPPTGWVVFAGANYFEMLGVRPSEGRLFSPDETALGANISVAVVSEAFRHRQLNPDSTAVGQRISIAGKPFTVIGVAQSDFNGLDLDATDIWLPLGSFALDRIKGHWWDSPNVNGFAVLVQPSRGATISQLDDRATLALRTYMATLTGGAPDSITVGRLGSIILARGPGEQKQEVKIATRLAGVAAIVLLIACANVINLLLARAVQRRREIAVRLALGISRARLIRLLVTESVLLALIAGAAAVVAAQWGGSLLRALLLPDVHWANGTVNLAVVLFAIVASVMAGVIAGVIPAWPSSRPDLTDSLKSGAREGGGQRSRLRSGLVVIQAALSVLLLAGAALFVRSLENVHSLGIGFASDRLTFASVRFDTRDSLRDAAVKTEMSQVAERLRSVPGVEQVALTGMQPMNGITWLDWFADRSVPKGKTTPTCLTVSPEYFAATGLRVVQGAGFSAIHGPATPPAVVINRAMAEEVWPGENPVGRCMHFGKADAPCYPIVGVVENARQHQIIEDGKPQYYVPFDNPPGRVYMDPTLIVRSAPSRAAAVAGEVRAMFRRDWPTGIAHIERMSTQLEPQYRPWRLGATLFSTFGLLALIVAAIGIYSTVSYGVTQRSHEFGVRVALGARVGDVLRLVIGEGMRTVAIGVALGIALALATGRLIASLLYGIQPTNAGVIAVVSLVLLVVAAAAALAPAWRAARVDPVNALRAE